MRADIGHEKRAVHRRLVMLGIGSCTQKAPGQDSTHFGIVLNNEGKSEEGSRHCELLTGNLRGSRYSRAVLQNECGGQIMYDPSSYLASDDHGRSQCGTGRQV